jgi:hypothetical protein
VLRRAHIVAALALSALAACSRSSASRCEEAQARFARRDSTVARRERGLGLVASALARCDGGLVIEPEGDGFKKGVVVRLFRALDGGSVEVAGSPPVLPPTSLAGGGSAA